MLHNLNCFQYTQTHLLETIAHQVWIEAPAQTVFNMVTLTDGLNKWWLVDCTAQPQLGHTNIFRLNGHVHNRMLITALVFGEFVEWECVNIDGLWTGTLLSFEITERSNMSILTFKHSGWPEQNDFFALCNFHWARHLLMLKIACETGKCQIDERTEANWARLAKRIY